jgi:murein DD-endopeptidase MepM/ murein hydrolase activator NlpD
MELPPSPTPPSAYASQLQALEPPPTTSFSSPVPGWNPPPLEVPIAHHPFDHYWLIRPVASNYNNSGLYYYPYGSNGPANDLRIHHGVDLANPIGVEVHAAGPGTVIWADRGHFNEYESITAYGNTVVIQHDFGYEGQPVYTLYAHLSAILVRRGDRVEAGQVIGLIGNTGQVSGPHVHFEVRVGRNSYFAVRNPELWMAPYSGSGVIAGRVVFDNGRAVEDVPITLIDLATGQVVARTTSYAGFGVNADDNWNENFVIADVPVGHYLVTASLNALSHWSGEVEVLAGTTNWVEMQFYAPTPAEESATQAPSP